MNRSTKRFTFLIIYFTPANVSSILAQTFGSYEYV